MASGRDAGNPELLSPGEANVPFEELVSQSSRRRGVPVFAVLSEYSLESAVVMSVIRYMGGGPTERPHLDAYGS